MKMENTNGNAEDENESQADNSAVDEDANNKRSQDDSEEDSEDDDINVVIGDIKSGPSYNIKARNAIVPAASGTAGDKPKQTGKFSIDEFESVGTINGQPAHEFSIDSLDEKPWRKPGADITDYFNYGFNEETWRAYCERQKRVRLNESGVGLQGLASGLPPGQPTIPNSIGIHFISGYTYLIDVLILFI